MDAGRIITFEGVDGVGKETQANLLTEALKEKGINAVKISFPRYDSDSSSLVKSFLNGDFKTKLPTQDIANLYAYDRLLTFDKMNIKEEIEKGTWFVFDRYVDSNVIYQSARELMRFAKESNIDIMGLCKNSMFKRNAFKEMHTCHDLNIAFKKFPYISSKYTNTVVAETIMKMHKTANKILKKEYITFGLPKQDMTFFLNVHPETSKVLRANRGTTDINESNEEYMILCDIIARQYFRNRSETSYNYTLKNYMLYNTIMCDEEDAYTLFSKEEIHESVMERVNVLIN